MNQKAIKLFINGATIRFFPGCPSFNSIPAEFRGKGSGPAWRKKIGMPDLPDELSSATIVRELEALGPAAAAAASHAKAVKLCLGGETIAALLGEPVMAAGHDDLIAEYAAAAAAAEVAKMNKKQLKRFVRQRLGRCAFEACKTTMQLKKRAQKILEDDEQIKESARERLVTKENAVRAEFCAASGPPSQSKASAGGGAALKSE